MSRFLILALLGAFGLSACAGTSDTVVSSRNYYEPVFVPAVGAPH